MPLGDERLQEQAVQGGVERADWPVGEFAAQVIGRAHRLVDRPVLGEPVIAGVIVDGDQRIAGRDGAADQVWCDDHDERHGRDANRARAFASRGRGAIDHEPDECRDDERDGGDAGQTGQSAETASKERVPNRWPRAQAQQRPHGKENRCCECVVTPAVDAPRNHLELGGRQQRRQQARERRQDAAPTRYVAKIASVDPSADARLTP